MNCLLPAVWLALQGNPPLHPYMAEPPPALQKAMLHKEPGRQICGESYPFHQETTHFTLQWEDPRVDAARVEAIGLVLEAAWTELVEERGWPAPVSSDACYLWFILDPSLGGSGYTTLYTSESYPEGYPVSWLSPMYYAEEYLDFALSVAAHEFVHMIQYGMEDWGNPNRSWFWESSAEWGAELSVPDLNMYALSTYWYARYTDGAYNTMANQHQYGMVAFNAWLDEYQDPKGFLEVWQSARQYPEEDWDARLERVYGLEFKEQILEFTGAYGAGALRESSFYYTPELLGSFETVHDEERVRMPWELGSWYVEFGGGELWVEEPLEVVFIQGGSWSREQPAAGEFIAVMTNPEAVSGFFSFGVEPDSGQDSEQDSAKNQDSGGEPPKACGCSGVSGGLWLGLIGLIVRRTSV